jgi:hypothetical protein
VLFFDELPSEVAESYQPEEVDTSKMIYERIFSMYEPNGSATEHLCES